MRGDPESQSYKRDPDGTVALFSPTSTVHTSSGLSLFYEIDIYPQTAPSPLKKGIRLFVHDETLGYRER